ncbi:DNA alkylation repair protein [Sphingobacterium suaedae]|uniref:DNA alkylation repair protein n=1 Tax=Sphingobacterium suaedae TaxID=1686402 RepID=A0ABW5KLC3_9SPHI
MELKSYVTDIRETLEQHADPVAAAAAARFFKNKETVHFYGIRAAEVRKISTLLYEHIKGLQKQDHMQLCEWLMQSRFFEEKAIACYCSEKFSKQYERTDFNVLQRWVNTYVDNWAICDTLCNHPIGNFMMKYPDYLTELKKWAQASNRWVRRAAAVSLIIPAKKGLFLDDIFEIADSLLLDKDDMVQKGYGWMLKAASQAYPDAVFHYVLSKKRNMPRTALRYAIEKMPADWKKEAMQK